MSDPDEQPGLDRRRCGARKKSGGVCGLPAGWGTDHVGFGRCRKHTGATESGRKAAEKERTAMRVAELRQQYTIPAEQVDPAAVLIEAVIQARALVLTWQHVVDELEAGEGGLWTSENGRAWPHGAAVELRKAIAEEARVAKWAADAGLDERWLQITEHQGVELAATVDRILQGMLGALLEAGLPAPTVHRVFETTAIEVVRRELLVTAGEDP